MTDSPPIDSMVYDDEVAPTLADSLNDLLHSASRHIALLAAWIATCGSLFFSEVLGWVPCMLCWYQRILMYPLAIILTVGILRRDRGIHWYVLPFSIAGIGVSLYHYLLIKTHLFTPPACNTSVPCTVDYIDWFGFINIPFMALAAFLIITYMMVTWAMLDRNVIDDVETDAVVAVPTGGRTAQVAVGIIIASVISAFLIGSTLV